MAPAAALTPRRRAEFGGRFPLASFRARPDFPAMPHPQKPRTATPARTKKRPTPSARTGLSHRDLNRATLARQLLLQRSPLPLLPALEQIAGAQAQLAASPYLGLWSRLETFQRSDLAESFLQHTVVRAPLLRATLHAVTAADYARFRRVLEIVLQSAISGMPKERLAGIDPPALAAEARDFLAEQPRTQEEVRQFLAQRHPKLDVRMMGHAVRLHLPLVQVPEPIGGQWGFPASPRFALADAWIARPPGTSTHPRELIRRYLAAFGPASARDFQTWSALPARDAFAELRSELVVLKDERGRELFDLPEAPRPSSDVLAPTRFLHEFDNLLLAHADRTRIIADEHRSRVFLPGLRVAATVLVDGFVAGTWKLDHAKKVAAIVVTPFAPLTKKTQGDLAVEGRRLAQFLAPDATEIAVKFVR